MHPALTILGHSVPSYGLLGTLGAFIAFAYAWLVSSRFSLRRDDTLYVCVGAMLGAVTGAKILYLVTTWPSLSHDLSYVLNGHMNLFPQLLTGYLSGGFVFYGGFIGAGAGAWLMCGVFHWRLGDFMPALAPAIPLFHTFGRIGCLLVGCCYGIPWSWGIRFSQSPYAPNHVTLFPTELMEASGEALIFLIVAAMTLTKRAQRWNGLVLWVALYAPLRFLGEFFRGDAARGFIGPLSTSQWISIALIAIVIAYVTAGRITQRPVPASSALAA